MKTFKDFKVNLSDKTPSFKSYSITVPTLKRNDAVETLKKEKIRFSSRGSSSGTFIFNDKKQTLKAQELFKDNDIKIMSSEL